MEDLGFRVGMSFGANCADPNLSAMLRASPTLSQGVRRAFKLTNQTITNCTLSMTRSAQSGHTYLVHSPSCNADNPAIEHIGWFGVMTLIGMVREYAGKDWQPTAIGLMTHRGPNRHIRDTMPGPRIRLSQSASYIELPDSMLSLPPPNSGMSAASSGPLDYEIYPKSFVGSLRTLIATYVHEAGFSIKHAAALCDTSARSLQRNLNKCGTSYSEVLDEARFHVAGRMLREPELPIAEIASRLGYANPTHFSRAFRRIAGVSPGSYRKAQTPASRAH
jgi:AraC-like DNA-binding protein